MASDDIVQPVGKPLGASPANGGDESAAPVASAPAALASAAVADAASATTLPRAVRIATSVVGWIVGVASLIGAASMAYAATDYPPNLVLAALLATAGAVVLPPVVGAARRVSPLLGSLWLPPLIYVVLVMSATLLSTLAAPHGAARQSYIARSLAAADQALKSHDPIEADRRMSVARDDAATNPAVRAMMARIEAERDAQLAVALAAARPPPPVDPVQAKLAELKRVDDALQARGLACRQAIDAFNGARDRVSQYAAASDAVGACRGGATLPSEFSDAVPEPFRDRLNGDLNACEHGYASVVSGMKSTTRIDDGDYRASSALYARGALEDGQDRISGCLAPYEADLAAAGLPKTEAAVPHKPGAGRRRRHQG